MVAEFNTRTLPAAAPSKALMQDIRYALRSLRKQPIFTLVAVLTLTLGIGANTAIFSLLYQMLLRPLPYPDADRLVFVWNTYPLMGLPQASVSIPDYIDRKTQAPRIEDAALFTSARSTSPRAGSPSSCAALAVTPSFFTTLQRQPFLGRGFTEEEAQPEADKFVDPDARLWKSRFGGDRSHRRPRHPAQRRGLPRRRRAARGLRAAGARHRRAGAVLVHAAADVRQGRGNEFSSMIARLRPGATIEQLNAQMKTIVDRNLDRLPQRQAFARDERLRRLRASTSASSSSAMRARRCSCCRPACSSCC